MHNILVIAQGTLVRQIRNKVLYLLIIISLCFVAVGSMYRVLSLGAEIKLMRDLGLAGISLIAMAVAVFVGSNEIGKEIREGTVDDLLAKPLGRDEFILGKYLGTFIVAALNIALITIGFVIILVWHKGTPALGLLRSVVLSLCEAGILIAVAVFFTSFLPEAVSAVITFLFFVIGHGAHMLPLISDKSGELPVKILSTALFYILPNLHHFNVRASIGQEVQVPWAYTACSILYGLCYTGMLLCISLVVFRKREL
ncbi:MAG: ABC transporter permease subunit [Planctomycetes bacterium]|nr:ABC transporter permease subunit [Planctomycetota bacterium]